MLDLCHQKLNSSQLTLQVTLSKKHPIKLLSLAFIVAFCIHFNDCAVANTPSKTASNAAPAIFEDSTASMLKQNPSSDNKTQLNTVIALPTGTEAFAARIALIAKAQQSIDLQSYIFHNDASGVVVLNELLAASKRGVKVRILLDDMNMTDLYASLAMLSQQPNIEIRLFNPLKAGSFRWLAFVKHPFLSNRRMHAKSLSSDNKFSIIGGRNIGNEYFEAGHESHFKDLDVIASGPVVNDVKNQFNAFWNSEITIDAKQYLTDIEAEKLDDFVAKSKTLSQEATVKDYAKKMNELTGLQQLLSGEKAIDKAIQAPIQLLVDSPEKVLGDLKKTDDKQIVNQLKKEFANPSQQLNLVSPYFVPGKLGVESITELIKSGVKVRILTNSLAATDVASVHAGYAKYRKDLLAAGVDLWELKADPRMEKSGSNSISTEEKEKQAKNSLHAKTFTADNKQYFVGSFNLDPRSAFLNAEMGFFIQSPELVLDLNQALDAQLPLIAWHVQLDQNQDMVWTDNQGQQLYADPGSSWLKRCWLKFLSWMPIEWAL